MADPINPGDVLDGMYGELWLVLDVTTPDDGVPTVRYKPITMAASGPSGMYEASPVRRFTGWAERTHTLAMVREHAPEKVDPKLAADVLRWWKGA